MDQLIAKIGTTNTILLIIASVMGAGYIMYKIYPGRNYILRKSQNEE